eukprot:scaffold24_cov341-Pavlova_lutheri.AAC.5
MSSPHPHPPHGVTRGKNKDTQTSHAGTQDRPFQEKQYRERERERKREREGTWNATSGRWMEPVGRTRARGSTYVPLQLKHEGFASIHTLWRPPPLPPTSSSLLGHDTKRSLSYKPRTRTRLA